MGMHKKIILKWIKQQQSNSADVVQPFEEATKVLLNFESVKY